MNEELQEWSDDIIYKHALTFSHDELAGMYSLCNKREQDYLKEIKSLRLILQSHDDIVEENARLREALDALSKDYISLSKKNSAIVVDLDEAIFCMRKSLFVNANEIINGIKNNILNQ